MEYSRINVLIVDDEDIVREGIKHIIDWNELGFCICDEASTGEEALDKIKKYNPGLVLLDIRMPKMYGTELIKTAREFGFKGDFIILSGYSDFKYAQTALHFGVSFYLTKPIDEEELEDAVKKVREKILQNQNKAKSITQYLKKAKSTVLFDLIIGNDLNESINYPEMGLSSPVYQIVIYEEYNPFFNSYSFADLLKVTNHGNDSFEHLNIDGKDVILLKGNFALDRLNAAFVHYENGTQKGSPLDSIFLTCGRVVYSLRDICKSYDDCCLLMNRRFFCDENQHVLTYDVLPEITSFSSIISNDMAKSYSDQLVDYIQTYNRRNISSVLDDIKNSLYKSGDNVIDIKRFMADIFLQIKHTIAHTFDHADIPFAPNASIIELIENKYYLYEILLYFTEQFDMIIRCIGNNSSDSVFDDILYYIEHNYQNTIKLETIAPLFGYNSSYLGKLFSQKMNQSFNSYLDEVRIKHAIELLNGTDMKVYEIAARVGYKNVDYFHQKFKKSMNMSPAEYRKNA